MCDCIAQAIAENFQTIISCAFTVLGTLVGVLLTSRLSSKNEKKRFLHERRSDVYFKTYKIVNEIIDQREFIFNIEFYEKLIDVRPGMTLLASKNTEKSFESLYRFVLALQNGLSKVKREIKEEYTVADDDDEQLIIDGDQYDQILDDAVWKYKKENMPDLATIKGYVFDLCDNMRKDLGN